MPTNAKTVVTYMSETEALERGILVRSSGFPVPDNAKTFARTPIVDAHVSAQPLECGLPELADSYNSLLDIARSLEVQRDDLLKALQCAVELMEQEDFATLSHLPKFRAAIDRATGAQS